MRVMLNGEARDLRDGVTVDALIRELGLNQRRIAVEVNRGILARTDFSGHQLRDGDVIEIVNFVGGG